MVSSQNHRDYGFLLHPKWFVLAVVTAGFAIAFSNLGLWQLDRLSERRLENHIIEQRGSVESSVTSLGLDELDYATAAEQHSFRLIRLSGTYLFDDEILIRSQTQNGVAGFHVITPLTDSSGLIILVNRGWVPLAMDTPPVSARPTDPEVDIQVRLMGTEERGRFGPEDPEGAVVLSRVDIERIDGLVDYQLAPIYGITLPLESESFPRPVEIRALSEGSHFVYAIQWFGFALISVGGFAALARTHQRI